MAKRIIAGRQNGLEVDAVGLRLQGGEDYPYLCEQGFSEDFLWTENTLLARNPQGAICRNPDGSAQLECPCGLVRTIPPSLRVRAWDCPLSSVWCRRTTGPSRWIAN